MSLTKVFNYAFGGNNVVMRFIMLIIACATVIGSVPAAGYGIHLARCYAAGVETPDFEPFNGKMWSYGWHSIVTFLLYGILWLPFSFLAVQARIFVLFPILMLAGAFFSPAVLLYAAVSDSIGYRKMFACISQCLSLEYLAIGVIYALCNFASNCVSGLLEGQPLVRFGFQIITAVFAGPILTLIMVQLAKLRDIPFPGGDIAE